MNDLILKTQIEMPLQAKVQQAEMLLRSGFLPTSIKTKEQVLVICQQGTELGLMPMQAFSSIYVVSGKPSISVQLMLALCQRTKELENFKVTYDNEAKPTVAKCTVKRKGMEPFTASFSLDDAKAQGLIRKDNWNKQAKVMLSWRSIAQALRFVFPDAILGLYTPDELGATVDVNPQTQEVVEVHDDVKVIPIQEPSEPQKAQEPPKEVPFEDSPDAPTEAGVGQYVMPIGKFKGLTLKNISDQYDGDKPKGLNYLEWFVSQEASKDSVRQIQSIIRKFLEGQPSNEEQVM